MSLPATHSQVSTHPDKMAVTAANDKAAQQADVERKLKLYGIIQSFRDGRMPDNQQINEALDFASKHSPVELSKLSPDGKKLVEDVRDIIETARMMIAEKNNGELFQNFVYSANKGDPSRGKKSRDELLPVNKDDATTDAKQGAAHLRTLLTLFATNSEARKLLNDVGYIARDVFATGAARAADRVRPDQDRLDQVDKTAPSGEFVSEDGRKVGRDETPVLQVKGPQGAEVRMHPKEDPANASVTDPRGNTRSAGETAEATQQTYQHARDTAQSTRDQATSQAQGAVDQQGGKGGIKQQAMDIAGSHAQDVRRSDHPLDAAREKKDEVKGEARGQVDRHAPSEEEKQDAKKGLINRIPEEHREKLSNQVRSTKDFLNEQFPQERRDNFIYRLKKVVVECQEHKDYQEAMQWLLDTAENYKGHATTVVGHGADSAQAVSGDPAYNQATTQFRTLLERFANNQSMQPLVDSIDRLYSDAQNDGELRQWWSQVNDYVHSALLEPGFLLDEDSDRQARQLQDSGKRFFQDKYKGHFQTFADEVQRFFIAMSDDPLNQRFGEDWKRLVKDLLFNDAGDLSYKPQLWNDIRRVVLPSLVQNIGYVPIPRAEYSDNKVDLVIENLILQGENLFPNTITIDSFNSFTFATRPELSNKFADQEKHTFHFGMSQIQADLRDVQFAYRRKTGWPRLRDSGLADVVIAGKGITIDLTVESVPNRRDKVIRVKDTEISIDTMRWSVKDAKHNMIYKIASSLFTPVLKKAIIAGLDVALRAAVEHLDDQLVEVRNRMEEAKRDDNELTRKQALKDMFAKKKDHAKDAAQKADEKTGTFKLVTDPSDSVVRDLEESKAKHSWTNRAFMTTEAAQSGADWRSPVFSLFSNKHPAVSGNPHPSAGNNSRVPTVGGTGANNVQSGAHAVGGNNVQSTPHATGNL